MDTGVLASSLGMAVVGADSMARDESSWLDGAATGGRDEVQGC